MSWQPAQSHVFHSRRFSWLQGRRKNLQNHLQCPCLHRRRHGDRLPGRRNARRTWSSSNSIRPESTKMGSSSARRPAGGRHFCEKPERRALHGALCPHHQGFWHSGHWCSRCILEEIRAGRGIEGKRLRPSGPHHLGEEVIEKEAHGNYRVRPHVCGRRCTQGAYPGFNRPATT